MQKCMTVNPFEAKFREANRRLTTGTLEANGLVPSTISLSNTNDLAFSLLKLPSSLSDSPGIFSNISILQTDADGMMNENLKTADISKLLLMDGSSTQQAPRTADVLNAVLDMHSDRLHTINYINKPDFSMFSSLTPSGSAPNSAGVLATAAAAQCTPSTSGGLLVHPSCNLLFLLSSNYRMTILERNKAAAVRYRKRKKEEHDDMISRVHTLEQEKVQLNTQNQVLRRELERMTALLREREARCVCLKAMPHSSELRAESPADQLINGLGLPNGMGLKRPKI
uniref:BZIP domain-containing protein n=1 Tax=Angiostrongylus cantonensis TaxID=6313 RepID=A0A0K0DK23_ANGCA